MPLMGTIAFDDETIESAQQRYDKYLEKRKEKFKLSKDLK
jgi:hypothetical protein